jgi:hypothetical protein
MLTGKKVMSTHAQIPSAMELRMMRSRMLMAGSSIC